MNSSSQPVALGPRPVLGITHRQRQPAAPTEAPHFSWYLCPQEGAFRHLVLLAGQQPLAHWVLPAHGPDPAEPTAGLWLRVTPDLGVALPVAAQASCQGAAWAVGQATAAAPALAELVLQLPTDTDKVYWMRQLRPGSASWLLRLGVPR